MKISTRIFVIGALAVAVGLAVAVSPYASSSPDGLNKVAADKGFDGAESGGSIQEKSPIPGYAFPGIENEKVAKGVAGFVGTLSVFALAYGIAYLLRRRDDDGTSKRGPTAASGAGS